MATISIPPRLQSHLEAFKKGHIGITRNDEIAFEHFVNYYVLSNEMPVSSISVEEVRKDVHTGGSGTDGIDGIAVLVNGKIASTKDDVDTYAGSDRGTTDAALHFFHTTTQDSYDESKVLAFLAGVEKFLSSDEEYDDSSFNHIIRERRRAYHHLVINKGANLKAGQPTFKIFYVFPGYRPMPYKDPNWWEMQGNNLGPIATNALRRINRLHATADNPIRFEIIDAGRLGDIQDNVTRRRVVASDVKFPTRVAVPDVKGAIAYLGLMNCKEYVDKIVRDPITSELNQNLAIDNARLFLGYKGEKDNGKKGVNNDIAATLQDIDAKKQFMLLNNGITIVATKANVPPNASMPCEIFNYQIVNGWQTTNVLFENYDYLDDDTYVPVRLVITEDWGLTENIVRATNTQTPVSEFQLMALSPRQLQLEDTYKRPPTGFDLRKINYKRQAGADRLIVDGPTIDVVSQMECYVSMFMGQPHQVNIIGYGELLRGEDNLNQYNTVFNDEHPDDFLYVAGYTLCEAESFIHDLYRDRYDGEQDDPSMPTITFDEMMNYKHHLLFLFRIMQTKGAPPPKANSTRGVQSYRDALLTVLSDQSKKENAFHDAVSVLKEGLKWYESQNHYGEARRWAGFTSKLSELTKTNAFRRKSRSQNRRAR